MSLICWLRNKFFHSDRETAASVGEIRREKARLSDAIEQLSKEVDDMKTSRDRGRRSLDALFDDVLRTVGKEKRH